MENIGDWLYVIIIAIAGIGSIISSVRKKAQQAQQQESQQTKPREIITEDTFDDDFWGNETTKQYVPENKPIPTVQSQFYSLQSTPERTDYQYNKKQEGAQSFTHNHLETVFADNEEEKSLITLEDLPADIDDWRKAFIHNEIFNRKY